LPSWPSRVRRRASDAGTDRVSAGAARAAPRRARRTPVRRRRLGERRRRLRRGTPHAVAHGRVRDDAPEDELGRDLVRVDVRALRVRARGRRPQVGVETLRVAVRALAVDRPVAPRAGTGPRAVGPRGEPRSRGVLAPHRERRDGRADDEEKNHHTPEDVHAPTLPPGSSPDEWQD